MIFLFGIVGLLMIGLSIPLMRRRVGPNRLYGLRVAETLESEEVWYEANARSGRDLLWLGVAILLLAVGLDFIPWRSDAHYALTLSALVIAGTLLFAARCWLTAKAVKRQLDERG